MGEEIRDAPSSAKSPEGRLDSWKEIATYLNRDVTTVQRWEKREGMPVYRHVHDKAGSVYAFRAELDDWARSRSPRGRESSQGETTSPGADPGTTAEPAGRRVSHIVAAGLAAGLILSAVFWLRSEDYFWRNPLSGAKFRQFTDFDGVAEAAAISRDGHFVAFLSDRDGPMDVWVSQVGSGQFHNLTKGSEPELMNPSVRTLGFSPDGSLVTFWVRKRGGLKEPHIGIWAVPTLGGAARPYLEEAAELDWSSDGSRIAYHTTEPGDPLYVGENGSPTTRRLLFQASAGLHCHFPVWSPDSKFIYFVQGPVPEPLDLWRIRADGVNPQRITFQAGRLGYPTLLDSRTLLYLASDREGSGPWLYGEDVERRIPHRLTNGPEEYTSMAASADGHRLVLTLAHPRKTLWRMRIGDSPANASAPSRIPLSIDGGSTPRFGPDYVLCVSRTGSSESIWKLASGAEQQLWSAQNARVIGGPAISSNGGEVAFSVEQNGRIFLYAMHADGTGVKVLSDSLELEGDLGWAPDGQAIATAVNEHGTPRLYAIPLAGGTPKPLVQRYSLDPVWEPDGRSLVYSGPDIGTKFSVEAANADGSARALPAITLARGARHAVFRGASPALIVLSGEIQHKNLWLIDLKSGAERQLTDFPADFDVRDFDISRDGREAILERVQERSDLVLVDLPRE